MLYPSGPAWTIHEDSALEAHYGTIPVKEILVKYPVFGNRSAHALHQRANKMGLKSPLKHTLYEDIKLDYFKRLTPESAYWGGFLAADGSLIKDPNKPNTYRLCLSIAVKDEAHLRLFQKTMGHTGEIGHVTHPEKSFRGQVIRSREMCFLNICQAGRFLDDLAQLGVIQDKASRIPPPILESDLLRLAFLRGYVDGDGSLSIINDSKFCLGIISSCKTLLLWFKALVDRLFPISYMDRAYSEVNANAASETWQYNVCGNRALRIISILSRIRTPELARKWRQPRLLEMIEQSKVRHPAVWATRLPIEDEIDAFFAATA